MGIRWSVLLLLEVGEVVLSKRNHLLLQDDCLVWWKRTHKSKHHWSQLGGNWLVLVRDVVTHQVPRHKIWLAKARSAVTCQLYFSEPFSELVLCQFITFYNSSYGCKAESEISWRGLPALECLPSAQCLQLKRNSGMSLLSLRLEICQKICTTKFLGRKFTH